MRLSKRFALLIGILMLSIAVLPLQAQDPISLVEMVPQEDVVVYAHANLDTLLPALEALGDIGLDEAFMSQFFGEEATVRSQLLSWMGDEIAFVYRFTEDDAINGTIGQAMVIAPVADMAMAETTLNGIARNFVDGLPEEDVTLIEETLTINGMDIQTYSVGVDLEGESDIFFSMALWDGFAALGNSPAIRGMLDILEGKDLANLSANTDYQTTLDSFEITPDAHFYLSPHGMRTINNLVAVSLMLPRNLRIPADGTQGVGAALDITEDVWQAEVSSILRDETVIERFGEFAPLQINPNTLDAANTVPSNVLAAILWGDVGNYVRYLGDTPRLAGIIGDEGGDIVTQLRPLATDFGFDLDEEFLAEMNNPLSAFAVYNPDSSARCDFGSTIAYDFGLALPVERPVVVEDLFTRLIDRLSEFPLVEQRMLTIMDITTDTFATDPSLFVGYDTNTETIIVGNNTAYDTVVATLNGAPTLVGNPQWQRASAYVSAENQYPVIYVDMMQTKAILDAQIAAGSTNVNDVTTRQWFEPFETLLLTMNFDDNRVLLHFDLLTMPDGATVPTLAPLTDVDCN